MPLSTGRLKTFKLEKYQEGILVRYPDPVNGLDKVGEFKENNNLPASIKN